MTFLLNSSTIQRLTVFFLGLAICLSSLSAIGQEKKIKVEDFKRVEIHPHIAVTFQKGDEESVRIVNDDIPHDKLQVKLRGKTLQIYLLDAKNIVKKEKSKKKHDYSYKKSIYGDATMELVVTYSSLEKVVVKGAEKVRVNGSPSDGFLKFVVMGESKLSMQSVNMEKFKLLAYGQNEISIENAELQIGKVKAYGENEFYISEGDGDEVTWKLYGENEVKAQELTTKISRIKSYGDNNVKVTANNSVKITAFGESEITYSGEAKLRKGITIGRTKIKRETVR
ncbi:GIN domain-containing protein [Aureibacter tunicatorum]|uniref:Putative auto-transporter adhesin head GIN domain-containing protein n=1 Tax=Aureibacter tunicatorum TaxID=866807 RepID=A0AAE3XK37_9BACT|nr:DUF2807 domain-containing protein [Aureibacter tunicatorum]MDR6237375.1 hypothetical protein [Aureibacter tunicatorum]BDD06366.1 hypothetical protein AUTU_38490 [Aureibacter tunicatorum]